jgi:hypothetical protein
MTERDPMERIDPYSRSWAPAISTPARQAINHCVDTLRTLGYSWAEIAQMLELSAEVASMGGEM